MSKKSKTYKFHFAKLRPEKVLIKGGVEGLRTYYRVYLTVAGHTEARRITAVLNATKLAKGTA